MMELFHEMYGCYYHVVGRILQEAHGKGLSKEEIDRIVTEEAFSESGLHLLPRLLSGEWDLLREKDGLYYSKLQTANTTLPLTALQKSWLKALLLDRRIRLFVKEEQIAKAAAQLQGVEPLFLTGDFHIFDAAGDGDPYEDKDYIQRFRLVLSSIKEQTPLMTEYEKGKGHSSKFLFYPQKLLYSVKDDKFRVAGKQLQPKNSKPAIINMARILNLSPAHNDCASTLPQKTAAAGKRSVTIAIYQERNALERCMLQFASYEKQTIFDEEKGYHICEISYDVMEETELLIRILSFGPVIKVLEPERMLTQIRQRIAKQLHHLEE